MEKLQLLVIFALKNDYLKDNIIKIMSGLPSGSGPIHAAAFGGNCDIVDMLISANCDVNKTNSQGQTALHIASQYGFIGVVRCLLDAGADRNIRDNNGYLPVDLAMDHARLRINPENTAMNSDGSIS